MEQEVIGILILKKTMLLLTFKVQDGISQFGNAAYHRPFIAHNSTGRQKYRYIPSFCHLHFPPAKITTDPATNVLAESHRC